MTSLPRAAAMFSASAIASTSASALTQRMTTSQDPHSRAGDAAACTRCSVAKRWAVAAAISTARQQLPAARWPAYASPSRRVHQIRLSPSALHDVQGAQASAFLPLATRQAHRYARRPWQKITMRDGARLNYLDIGRAAPRWFSSTALALTSSMWLPFVLPLARRYRFIARSARLRRLAWPAFQPARPAHRTRTTSKTCCAASSSTTIHLGGLSMGACTAAMPYPAPVRLRPHPLRAHGPVALPSQPLEWPWGLMGERHAERMASAAALALPRGS